MQESQIDASSATNYTERSQYAFMVGQTNVWFQAQTVQAQYQSNQKDENSANKVVSPYAAIDTLSHDSASTDEGAHQAQGITNQLQYIRCAHNLCNIDGLQLTSILKVKAGMHKLYDIDSRVGLNGSRSLWSFNCLQDEESKCFFVLLGDLSLEKFTKTTFLNLVSFAEKTGSKQLILIQNRDHQQKEQFQRMFNVLDAHRMSKRGMEKVMTSERINEWIQKFALYRIDLQ
eukprot:403360666